MIKQFMKMGGVKTEKEFYDKYPTEESFFEAFPQAQQYIKQKGGAQDPLSQVIMAVAQQLQIDPNQLAQMLQQDPNVVSQLQQMANQDPQKAAQALMQLIQSSAAQGQSAEQAAPAQAGEMPMDPNQAMQAAYGGSKLNKFIRKDGGDIAFPQAAPMYDNDIYRRPTPNFPRLFGQGGMYQAPDYENSNETELTDEEYASRYPGMTHHISTEQGKTDASSLRKNINIGSTEGMTVSQIWTKVTGLPWSEAKKRGLTDGTYASNIALKKQLLQGNKPSSQTGKSSSQSQVSKQSSSKGLPNKGASKTSKANAGMSDYDRAMAFPGFGEAKFVDPETYVGSPGYYRGLTEQWGYDKGSGEAYDKAMAFPGFGEAKFVDPETYVGSPGYYAGMAEQWGASKPGDKGSSAYDRAMAFPGFGQAKFVDPETYVGSPEYYEAMAEKWRPRSNKKEYGGNILSRFQAPTEDQSNETGSQPLPPWAYGAMGAAAGPATLALGYGASQLAGPMLYPIDPDAFNKARGQVATTGLAARSRGISLSEAAAKTPEWMIPSSGAGLDKAAYDEMKEVYKNIAAGTDELYNELQRNAMKKLKIADPKKLPPDIVRNLQQQALLSSTMAHTAESGEGLKAARNMIKVAKLNKFVGAPVDNILNEWVNTETGMSRGAKAWEILKPSKTAAWLMGASVLGGIGGWAYGSYKNAKSKINPNTAAALSDTLGRMGANAEMLNQAANAITTPNSSSVNAPTESFKTDKQGNTYQFDPSSGFYINPKDSTIYQEGFRRGGSLQNSPLGYGQFNVAFDYGGQSYNASPGVYDPDNVIEANKQILKGYIDAQQGNMRTGGSFKKKI